MSIQFGRWNFDGQPVDPRFIQRALEITTRYGSDGETVSVCDSVSVFYRPFHTTRESSDEKQPLATVAGILLTWDGRLDNRSELIRLLRLDTNARHTDAGIALAAYQLWSTAAFAKLIGDWALAIWDPIKQALFLAKDFAGVRQLFYRVERNRITWSTLLDPLVLLAERSLQISEEFIAGYLSNFPPVDATPYVGIDSVPASTFVEIKNGRRSICAYWQFDPGHRVRHRTDAEYEEEFRQVFSEAVRRRLRASSPVLAELSGGMDSTSIVCMADAILAKDKVDCPRLDTVSYYDDQEPNWDERPYFSLVEKKRGREGHHINVGGLESAFLPPDEDHFFSLPGYDSRLVAYGHELSRCLEASQSRVLLSGIGGDEFLGGVPTPTPGLQDLFVHLHWVHLAHQLSEYSLEQRRPWLHLWFDTVEEYLPRPIRRLYKTPRVPSWLTPAFVRRNAEVFWADTRRRTLLGACPSFQSDVSTLDHLRRQLNCYHLANIANHRKTFPYFDRDLLTFLFAIPYDQLVRPHHRRSLMRRAFVGVVPEEILTRKRKAFIARRPLALIDAAMLRIADLLESPLIVAYGWMDPKALRAKLEAARNGDVSHAIPLTSTIQLELWLRTLVRRNLLEPLATRRSFPKRECHKRASAPRLTWSTHRDSTLKG